MTEIKALISEDNGGNLLIGDFNAKIEKEGTLIWEDKEVGRESSDKMINIEGKKFLEEVEEKGWNILNGNITGDEGEFT
ncbi:hypothetical protein P5V15_015542 [Pogonomyrmex californicus]